MEDIIEFIVEIVLEALMAMLQSEKVPYFIRATIYLLTSIFLWFLAIFICICAFKAKTLWSIILLLLGCIIIWIWYKMSATLNFMKKDKKLSSFDENTTKSEN